MEAREERIVTVHPSKKAGIGMPKELYDKLTSFIITTILDDASSTMISLLAKAEKELDTIPNLNWFLMHVKLDLEARGFLKIIPTKSVAPGTLKVTNRGLAHHLKSEN